MPTFAREQLEDVASSIFEGAGVPADEARIVAASLVASNLLGHDSHGVIRIPQYLVMIREKQVVPGVPVDVIRETPATALLDGNYGSGQIVGGKAMEIAIDKAAQCGSSSVAVRNSNHVGRLGEYPMMAAERGMIGMAMVNNHGGGLCMASWGGVERRLSPNPMACAIPTGRDRPFLLDMTSSVCAEGKLRVARNKGDTLPEGWIINSDGNPSTDPAAFYGPPQGALLPLGGSVGYKGFGLCMMMDIMAGALSGAGCSGSSDALGLQALFITVTDIAAFATPVEFEKHVEQLTEYVKSPPLLPGVDEVLAPGEPEFRREEERLADGIPIDDGTWRQIVEAAESVGADLSATSKNSASHG